MSNTARVTYSKGITDGATTTYDILLDGEKVGTVDRSRETSVVLYAGAGYGRPVTRTEWWAHGMVPKRDGSGRRSYSNGYGRTTRKDAVTGLIAEMLQVTPREALAIVETR